MSRKNPPNHRWKVRMMKRAEWQRLKEKEKFLKSVVGPCSIPEARYAKTFKAKPNKED